MMPTLMMVYMWVFGGVIPGFGLVFTIYWSLDKAESVIVGLLGLFGFILVGLPIYYTLVFFFGGMIFG
ncbi:hypothetical protein [Enterobacter phage vB_ExiM_F5M1E]|nr:hypothetical protein [Enterobacter phage vB_ExiM_F1M1E]UNA03139.1 hypothetical protein [Enterobacter phage vB_ExiM_F2M1E]UNA03460.1 hypothetical protein [Enterobacter phage vB_ExiM_F4M1E]UNA03781.1 hypothetical protein [Enterobacter phage vB_ExiM_F5M1E]UNA04101.1 hypothetical protein [Pantoea phage vB_PdiM_F5M2A]